MQKTKDPNETMGEVSRGCRRWVEVVPRSGEERRTNPCSALPEGEKSNVAGSLLRMSAYPGRACTRPEAMCPGGPERVLRGRPFS